MAAETENNFWEESIGTHREKFLDILNVVIIEFTLIACWLP